MQKALGVSLDEVVAYVHSGPGEGHEFIGCPLDIDEGLEEDFCLNGSVQRVYIV